MQCSGYYERILCISLVFSFFWFNSVFLHCLQLFNSSLLLVVLFVHCMAIWLVSIPELCTLSPTVLFIAHFLKKSFLKLCLRGMVQWASPAALCFFWRNKACFSHSRCISNILMSNDLLWNLQSFHGDLLWRSTSTLLLPLHFCGDLSSSTEDSFFSQQNCPSAHGNTELHITPVLFNLNVS